MIRYDRDFGYKKSGRKEGIRELIWDGVKIELE